MSESTLFDQGCFIRHWGRSPYEPVWQAMQQFTNERTPETPDELWLVEHEPVYTLGQNGKLEHLLNPKDIPVVQTDRGGQITYHGPGQSVVYILYNLKRQKKGIRQLVRAIEQSVIDLLAEYGIESKARCDAPGVYVNDAKIASLGLRVRRGCTFHGLSLNVNMDLAPFLGINPCGMANLAMTQTASLGGPTHLDEINPALIQSLQNHLY